MGKDVRKANTLFFGNALTIAFIRVLRSRYH